MIFEPSKKLQRMIAWRDKLYSDYAGTWCELFKTEGYKKSKIIQKKLESRIIKQVEIESCLSCYFEMTLHRLHRFSALDIKRRKSYKYVVECKEL